ncbi:MAG: hypothetical protein PHO54_00425 [Candidatus Peribacteraceae bacterium]|nr:hypothetical protein [Candidatus Peribacteraceae bacterium]
MQKKISNITDLVAIQDDHMFVDRLAQMRRLPKEVHAAVRSRINRMSGYYFAEASRLLLTFGDRGSEGRKRQGRTRGE